MAETDLKFLVSELAKRKLPNSELRLVLWLLGTESPRGKRHFYAQIGAVLQLSESSVQAAVGSLVRAGILVMMGEEKRTGRVLRVVKDPSAWKPDEKARSLKPRAPAEE